LPRSGRLRAIIRQAERLSYINYHVPTVGRRRYMQPVKRGIQSLVRWYVGAVVGQIQEFVRADVHALRVTADLIESLEDRVQQLEARIARLEGDSDTSPER
jgi:ubiquinone biosynthesis protein UbiJ